MPASLPMYDFPDARKATDSWWSGLARHMSRAGIPDVPARLLRRDDLIEQWRDPALLISQTCGYLMTHQLRSEVRPVATPHYTAPGCAGPAYASVILARRDHPGNDLADFRGGVAVYSRTYSHAGHNAFRGMIAPLANGKPFFSRVIGSGSHLDSIATLATGKGDLATVDCVIHAFVSRWRPAALAGTRVLGFTAPAPAPPYVAPISASDSRIARLRQALDAAVRDPDLSAARDDLFIAGFSHLEFPDYSVIASVETEAIAHGYPNLA
jgi:ABC-type phosphate/phosphonate transport system substrate-binding protein